MRQTSQRNAIRSAFVACERPLRVDEIRDHGRTLVPTLSTATVYRNLAALVEEGWLQKIEHPGLGSFYERTGKEHHHHFYCRVCDRLLELPGCALSACAAPTGFRQEHHDVFLYGVCPSCE